MNYSSSPTLINNHLHQPTSFLIVLTASPLPLSVLVGRVGILPLTPSRTPVSAVNYILISRFTRAALANTTYSAAPGDVAIRVLPVKYFITLQVPTLLTYVGFPAIASNELPFT